MLCSGGQGRESKQVQLGFEMGAQSDPFGEEMSLSIPPLQLPLGYRSAQAAAVVLSGQKSCALVTFSS